MAMTMQGEVQLGASREAVWAKLNDPEVLKACIPGCEELERTEDNNGFRAAAKMKVGPVSARFKGKVALSDLDPPNGYRISGEGEGGVAGFAKGGATVALSEKDGGTLLKYDVEAQIGGKLAQRGRRPGGPWSTVRQRNWRMSFSQISPRGWKVDFLAPLKRRPPRAVPVCV